MNGSIIQHSKKLKETHVSHLIRVYPGANIGVREILLYLLGITTLKREGSSKVHLEESLYQNSSIVYRSKYLSKSLKVLGGELHDEVEDIRELLIEVDEYKYQIDLDRDVQTISFDEQIVTVE